MGARVQGQHVWGEGEKGGGELVQGQPVLQKEFQDIEGYTKKPCLKKTNSKQTK